MAGAVPWTWEAGYAASKAAVIALCEATAPELRRNGVHIGWINPGLVRTEIFSEDALRHLPKGAERTWIEPQVLSAAIIDCIKRERAGLTVPRYMAFSAVLRHVAPAVFRAGIRRTYEGTLRHDGNGAGH
jgi:short-subunit dehydrogenase